MVRNQGQEAEGFQLLFPQVRRVASHAETQVLKLREKFTELIIRSWFCKRLEIKFLDHSRSAHI
jgi:hypothetical protein